MCHVDFEKVFSHVFNLFSHTTRTCVLWQYVKSSNIEVCNERVKVNTTNIYRRRVVKEGRTAQRLKRCDNKFKYISPNVNN